MFNHKTITTIKMIVTLTVLYVVSLAGAKAEEKTNNGFGRIDGVVRDTIVWEWVKEYKHLHIDQVGIGRGFVYGLKVKIEKLGLETTTDGDGYFSFVDLPPGEYRLSFESKYWIPKFQKVKVQSDSLSIVYVYLKMSVYGMNSATSKAESFREQFKQGHDPVSIIEYDLQYGKIDYETAVLYKVYAMLDYKRLPLRYRGPGAVFCGTLGMAELRQDWRRLSEGMKQVLRPYFKVLPGDTVITLDFPQLPLEYQTVHFVLHYTIAGTDAVPLEDNPPNGIPDYVENFGIVLENCWNDEIGNMGYRTIPAQYVPVNVYLYNLNKVLDGYGRTEYNSIEGLKGIGLDNDYLWWSDGTPFPLVNNHNPTNDKRITAAHEFFHAIQFSAYDWQEIQQLWWVEGTAVWMEDEVYDNINCYVEYLEWDEPEVMMGSILKRPHFPLDYSQSKRRAGSVLIWAKHLAERKGVDRIRKIWERCREVAGYNSLQANEDSLGGSDSLKKYFKTFVCANYIKIGEDGYQEGGLANWPNVKIEQEYNSGGPGFDNQHYAASRPPSIGDPVPWEQGNFPSGMPMELPHLASYYIRVVKPVQIDTRTNLYFNFEKTSQTGLLALMAVKVKNDTIKEKMEITLSPENNSVYNYPIPIGGSDWNDIKEIIFIPTTLHKTSDIAEFRYSFAIVPVFQQSYQENPGNGSTKEVLNLDSDNWYKPKEKVRLKVDLSDKVHIGNSSTLTADFSQVDKAFDPAKVKITEVDAEKHEYQIEYELSNTLADPNQLLPVIIRVKDMTNDPNHQPKETIFNLRVQGPPVIEETDPADGAQGVDIFKKVKLVFNKPMDTVSVREALTVARLEPPQECVLLSCSWDSEAKTLEVLVRDPLVADSGFEFFEDYAVIISGQIAKDTAGVFLDGDEDGDPGGNKVFTYKTRQPEFTLWVNPPDILTQNYGYI